MAKGQPPAPQGMVGAPPGGHHANHMYNYNQYAGGNHYQSNQGNAHYAMNGYNGNHAYAGGQQYMQRNPPMGKKRKN